MKKLRITPSEDTKVIIANIQKSTLTINNKYINQIDVPRKGRTVQTPVMFKFNFLQMDEKNKVINCTYEVHASFMINSYWVDRFGYIVNLVLPRIKVYGDAINVYEEGKHFDVIIMNRYILKAMKNKVESYIEVINV